VKVEWENGEITSEPLSIVAADDPVSCAIYARDNNLLEIDEWKRFWGIAKHQQNCTTWLTKLSADPFTWHLDSSTDMRCQESMDIPTSNL
jgi:hypothetical protein